MLCEKLLSFHAFLHQVRIPGREIDALFAEIGCCVERLKFLLTRSEYNSRTSRAYSLGFLFQILLRCSCGSDLERLPIGKGSILGDQ